MAENNEKEEYQLRFVFTRTNFALDNFKISDNYCHNPHSISVKDHSFTKC